MIIIAGLGPGDWDRIPGHVTELLTSPSATVIARTLHHPAAKELSRLRDVISCDDLYESSHAFDDVYEAIARRVLEAAVSEDVVYAVPGSPLIGEQSVRLLMESDAEVRLVPGESFLDAVLAEVGYDPLDRGLQILNAHDLPDPLILEMPTVITQVDRPEILADVAASVDAVTAEGTTVVTLANLGTAQVTVSAGVPADIAPSVAGLRTTLFIDPEPGGLIGAVRTMRRLREECPWDRDQTHESLIKNLVEEMYELIDAIRKLPEDRIDVSAYAAVEDELGDVLLQVLFHTAIGRQIGAFDIDSVAEGLRLKLVRRHPHVFSDVVADTPDEVKANWDLVKNAERGKTPGSMMEGIPESMPALYRASKMQNRASKIGFDWDSPQEVVPKVYEELEELKASLGQPDREVEELGDLLFTVVNLARHLDIDPEIALRQCLDRVEERFRLMEAEGPLDGLTLSEMNDLWERAKRED